MEVYGILHNAGNKKSVTKKELMVPKKMLEARAVEKLFFDIIISGIDDARLVKDVTSILWILSLTRKTTSDLCDSEM